MQNLIQNIPVAISLVLPLVLVLMVVNNARTPYRFSEYLSDIIWTAFAHQTGNQAGSESGFEIIRVLQLAHGISGYKIELAERDIVMGKYGVVFPRGMDEAPLAVEAPVPKSSAFNSPQANGLFLLGASQDRE